MSKSSFFSRSELTRTLWGFRREFLTVGVFSLVSNLLMLSPTLYMLQVYDRVMVSNSELTLLAVSLITLFLFAIMAFSDWIRSRLLVRTGVKLDKQLSTRVFNASFEAYLTQSKHNPSRAFSDLVQIRQFLTGNGIFAFFDAPWTPIYIAVLFLLHPFLGGIAIVFALTQAALGWFGHRHTVLPAEAASKALSESNQFLQSKIRNAEVLESMGMVPNLQKHWDQKHLTYLTQHTSSQSLGHRIAAWSKFIRYSQQSLALGAGALLVVDGLLTPGGMIAANVLMSRALAPIDQIIGTWRNFASVRAAFERLEQMLQAHPERDTALRRVAPKGDLLLRQVTATAPGRNDPILKGIDLQFPMGSVTAILGPSGSGKSTLARVMVGIWPDVNGEVVLDGLPLNSWDRNELGPYLGYLPQDIELFEGSIADNIARFSDIDSAKVIAAAKCTGLHDMILRFPKGYDTPMGEAGGLLSGGQRQRIALARAVYGDPTLVVLDEPNANLDDAGEQALLQTVRTLQAQGKTVVLITHRPGALAAADRLVLIRDGRVQIHGPRDEVLRALAPPPQSPQPHGASGALPAA